MPAWWTDSNLPLDLSTCGKKRFTDRTDRDSNRLFQKVEILMKTSTLAISLSLSLSLSAAGCNVQFVPEADAAADAAPVVDNGTTPPADAGS
jgi:hypothetical protein